jgi:hypothetical protein
MVADVRTSRKIRRKKRDRRYAPLKQRAWDAAVAAAGKMREEASYNERETAAVQAVQPMIREYEQQQTCERIVGCVYISDATFEELQAAREAVRQALAAMPVGAVLEQLEMAEKTALAPYKAAAAARNEKTRQESEKRAQLRAAALNADLQLGHISRYLEAEYKFDGGYWEMHREAERLRPLIREALIEELLENPDMSNEEIRESIEDQIDDGL